MLGRVGKLIYLRIVRIVVLPVLLYDYFRNETGAEYGIALREKIRLLLAVQRNTRSLTTGVSFEEHMVMVTKLLQVPASRDGCVVECGCYKGGSTATLSLVASLTGREFHVFDSFEGLPEPTEADSEHTLVQAGEVHTYDKRAYEGSLAEVRSNVAKYGDLSVCEFHEGYFKETLPGFNENCVLVFEDVDLRESTKTTVRYLWPLMRDGSYFFCHEAQHHEVASLFFDSSVWDSLGADPPGLIGAGSGLGLSPALNGFRSAMGYAVKNPEDLEEKPQEGL